ncbi:MAG: hypothetical protein KatS3mg077_2827 [Candidatus Binatia bacterium]|nr:MAG: hypothetical protein KatS3mg077_2827 [Candidatus Binatia bacterium]
MPNITPDQWNYDTAAHLLLRSGFGHNGSVRKSTGEATLVRTLAMKTPEQAVDWVLRLRVPARVPQGRGNLVPRDWNSFSLLRAWWLERMIKPKNPALEKIVLFLHTHFATAQSRVNKSLYMAKQNALFRAYALGDFRELVKAMNIDPAMLWWLDGQSNTRRAPNENYARELMELFTLGVFDFAGNKNYSQNDVKVAARMLTGWRIRELDNDVESYFDMNRHDRDTKILFQPDPNETPSQNPANTYTEPASTDPAVAVDEHRRLIDAIFHHRDTEGRPTAARFLVRKLWKFYAYDPIVDAGTSREDLSLIDELADVFVASGYRIPAVLRAMFLRAEFYAHRDRTVKSPVEYVVGSIRMLRVKPSGTFYTFEDSLVQLGDDGNQGKGGLTQMGQTLFDPPDVFSWKGNQYWITSHTLLQRAIFASRLCTRRWPPKKYKDPVRAERLLPRQPLPRAEVVDRFLRLLGPIQVDEATRQSLIQLLGPTDPFDPQDDINIFFQLNPLLQMILMLPQYHVH